MDLAFFDICCKFLVAIFCLMRVGEKSLEPMFEVVFGEESFSTAARMSAVRLFTAASSSGVYFCIRSSRMTGL